MSDPSSQIIEFFRHVDAATGGYPSHMLERLVDSIWDKGLSYGRRLLFQKTADKMHAAGKPVSETSSPRLIADILRNADGVTDETIMDLWASLLAKAATGDDKNIRPIYFDLISKLSPRDALVFSILGSEEIEDTKELLKHVSPVMIPSTKRLHRSKFIQTNSSMNDYELSFCYDALERLGLVEMNHQNYRQLSILGRGFYQTVCSRNQEDTPSNPDTENI
ncbi:DUF4393 domain-containing protein [Gluconobacter sp. LMG 1744]|uniref:Abi-alpha family protein n=1 Tax=Gluconobacter TaxID=441 RepID=UPI0018854210|nr:Abi-alpha family protein [Gluconobacter cadivus]MBF0892498.1 DUF4393 domain-containing protein [Gluconobacter cadivus]